MQEVGWLTLIAILILVIAWMIANGFESMRLSRLRLELIREQAILTHRGKLFESIADSVTICPAGVIIQVSQETCRLFGYTPTELIGHDVRILMPEPYHSQHPEYLNRYLRTGEKRIIGTPGRELEAVKKDGTKFPILLTISEVVQSDGGRVFVGTIRDITAEKWRELSKLSEGSTVVPVPAGRAVTIIPKDPQS